MMKTMPNVEVTGAARLYRAASVWTAVLVVSVWMLGVCVCRSANTDFSKMRAPFAVRYRSERRLRSRSRCALPI